LELNVSFNQCLEVFSFNNVTNLQKFGSSNVCYDFLDDPGFKSTFESFFCLKDLWSLNALRDPFHVRFYDDACKVPMIKDFVFSSYVFFKLLLIKDVSVKNIPMKFSLSEFSTAHYVSRHVTDIGVKVTNIDGIVATYKDFFGRNKLMNGFGNMSFFFFYKEIPIDL